MNQTIDRFSQFEYRRLIYYLRSINYIRVAPEKITELKDLLNTGDEEELNVFLENQKYEEGLNVRIKAVNLDRLVSYYQNKYCNLTLPFRLFERILSYQKHNFSLENSLRKSAMQATLFDAEVFTLKNTIKERVSSTTVITGQETSWFKNYSEYAGVNYLDYDNVLRIVDFFDKSKLSDKSKFIEELAKITQKEFYGMNVENCRYFMKFYALIEKALENNENINGLIWSVNDSDWETYKYAALSSWMERFYEEVNKLVQFFKASAKFENHAVIMNLEFQ